MCAAPHADPLVLAPTPRTDLIFGFKDGDVSKPECAAGVAVQGILNMGMGFHGDMFYKFQCVRFAVLIFARASCGAL